MKSLPPNHQLPLPRWLSLGATLALAAQLPSHAQTQVSQVIAGFGVLTSAAGGNGQGSGNPNEWNVAFEGGPASVAELSEPHMAMDDLWGNIYVADKNAHAIRKITPSGTIHTVAGRHQFASPNVGAFDGDGIATDKLLSYPNGLFVFPDGSFYFLEAGDAGTQGRIRKVDRAGQMTTLYTEAGNVMQRGLWVSADESVIYFTTNTQLRRLLPGQPLGADNPRVMVSLNTSAGLANIDVDAQGNILLASRGNSLVYLVPPTANNLGTATIVAGNGIGGSTLGNNLADSGQVATSIVLNEARGVAYHPLGGYFVACHKGGDIWYVDTQTPPRIHLLIQGNDRDSNSNPLRLGDGELITDNQSTSKLAEPRSIRFGWQGDLIICCNDSGFVRVVKTTALRTKFAATSLVGGISWAGETSKTYFVESSPDLGQWATRKWFIPTAAQTTTFQEPSTLPQRQFYRTHSVRRWPF